MSIAAEAGKKLTWEDIPDLGEFSAGQNVQTHVLAGLELDSALVF